MARARAICFALLLAGVMVISLCAPALGGGLAVGWAEVVMENLPLGTPFNVRQEKGLPLMVTNRGEEAIDIKIEVLKPQPAEMKPGYAPIPDVAWVKVVPETAALDAGKSLSVDVVFNIPDKEEYRGKRYQFWIWTHTVGGALGVGLKSRVLIGLSPGPQENAVKAAGPAAVAVTPTELTGEVRPGVVRLLGGEDGALSVANHSDQECAYEINSLRLSEDEADNPRFVYCDPDRVRVGPGRTVKVRVYTAFPSNWKSNRSEYRCLLQVRQSLPGGSQAATVRVVLRVAQPAR